MTRHDGPLRARAPEGGTPALDDWGVDSEYGTLREVLLGPVESFHWMADNAAYSRSCATPRARATASTSSVPCASTASWSRPTRTPASTAWPCRSTAIPGGGNLSVLVVFGR